MSVRGVAPGSCLKKRCARNPPCCFGGLGTCQVIDTARLSCWGGAVSGRAWNVACAGCVVGLACCFLHWLWRAVCYWPPQDAATREHQSADGFGVSCCWECVPPFLSLSPSLALALCACLTWVRVFQSATAPPQQPPGQARQPWSWPVCALLSRRLLSCHGEEGVMEIRVALDAVCWTAFSLL